MIKVIVVIFIAKMVFSYLFHGINFSLFDDNKIIRFTIYVLGMFVHLIISVMCVKFVADNKGMLGCVYEEDPDSPYRILKKVE